MTPPTFHQALTAWQMAIKGEKHFPLPPEIVCETAEVFDNQCAQLMKAKIEQNKLGFDCQFNKGRSGSKRMAWIKSGLYTLKIVYNAGKRAQAVTQTSRDAYHSIDLGERCEAVARAAIRLGECTDNEVGREIGMPANLVSGRRNDIEKEGIVIDGTLYTVEMTGQIEMF